MAIRQALVTSHEGRETDHCFCFTRFKFHFLRKPIRGSLSCLFRAPIFEQVSRLKDMMCRIDADESVQSAVLPIYAMQPMGTGQNVPRSQVPMNGCHRPRPGFQYFDPGSGNRIRAKGALQPWVFMNWERFSFDLKPVQQRHRVFTGCYSTD